MAEVTCTECKKQTTVPFTPTPGKPVYCNDCFKKKRETRGAGGRGGPRGRTYGNGPKTTFSRDDYPTFHTMKKSN